MPLTIAMVVPPTVNLNTPYAAAPRLAGWLRHLGHRVVPVDMSLELFLAMFSRAGLERMFGAVDVAHLSGDERMVYDNRDRYVQVIDDAVAVVQLRDLAATARFVDRPVIPRGPHVRAALDAADHRGPGVWGQTDYARHLVSLMFADLAALFQSRVSSHVDLTSYGAHLARSQTHFGPVAQELERAPTVYEQLLFETAEQCIPQGIDLACLTCPFPGNLLGALQLGKWLSTHRPGAARALGGGYPSTELRWLEEPRVFDYVDYVVLDDGEVPLRRICERVAGQDSVLHNTYTRVDNKVVFHPPTSERIPFAELPTPSYRGFDMSRYVHLVYQTSALQRSNAGAWLKLTAAHGCYWKRCTFCDISLPYIADYDPIPARRLADQMDELHDETGLSGFHFTDEAAPPALLVNLALELLRRKRNYHWWGNVRYDRAFEPDRCRLLAAAGMLSVMGGIEAASDSVLENIDKGVSIPQLVKVLQALRDAGIAAHGYLIYGFPGETVQDSVDGLEVLRQLVSARLLGTGSFHRLSVTEHAPLGTEPERFGIRLNRWPHGGFARNAVRFEYLDGVPRGRPMHLALSRAMLHYERREHLDRPVVSWFEGLEVPPTQVAPDFVDQLMRRPHPGAGKRRRLCWLGGQPTWSRGLLSVRGGDGDEHAIAAPASVADGLHHCHPDGWIAERPPSTTDVDFGDWLDRLRPLGLVVV